jgi:hypothetical protein
MNPYPNRVVVTATAEMLRDAEPTRLMEFRNSLTEQLRVEFDNPELEVEGEVE